MRSIILLMAMFGLAVLAGFAYLSTGQVSFGADEPHPPLLEAFIRLVRERSIASHSSDVGPPDLNSASQLQVGAHEYADMCEGCHLGPGVHDNEFRAGLYPKPPNLAEARAHGEAREPAQWATRDFWIIKHGLQMTGMPAWGKTHDDPTLWSIVAFVEKLPQMSASDYARATHAAAAPAVSLHHHHDADDAE